MKSAIIGAIAAVIAALVLPVPHLIILMFVAIFMDFLTGVGKAVATGIDRTSSGYRASIGKFVQYGGSIAIAILLATTAKFYKGADLWVDPVYLINSLVSSIIFVEVTSILENINAAAPNSKLSQYFVRPLLKICTLKLENFFPQLKVENKQEAAASQIIKDNNEKTITDINSGPN